MLTAAMNAEKLDIMVLKEENDRLKRVLEERKIIDRGKGIIMEKEGIPEDEAYRRIQKLSMDSRKKMADIAMAIILAEEVRR